MVPGLAGAVRVLRCATGLPAGLKSPGQTLRQNDAPGALVPSTGMEPRGRGAEATGPVFRRPASVSVVVVCERCG
jgi:hypothetical protein